MSIDRPNDPRRDIEAKLIERAAREATFREALLRDPKAAVEAALSAASGNDVQLPAHVRVIVHEETADTFHLVLPPVPSSSGELSDADLAGLAGGLGKQTSSAAGCVSAGMCQPI